jgi:hypothetical protein
MLSARFRHSRQRERCILVDIDPVATAITQLLQVVDPLRDSPVIKFPRAVLIGCVIS